MGKCQGMKKREKNKKIKAVVERSCTNFILCQSGLLRSIVLPEELRMP